MPVIDSHHHLWDPDNGEFTWMTDEVAPLRRIFSAEDLRPLIAEAGVDATVLVQTQHRIQETHEYLQTAHDVDFVAGVVGWVDITDEAIAKTVADLLIRSDGRYLVGIRHLVHDEPDAEWLCRPDVRRGLEALQRDGLVYDLLLRPRELPAAIKTVEAMPDMRFVVDHIAKPDIANQAWEPWAENMRRLGQAGDVYCKLSGMVTEANWESWKPDDLRPYIEEAIDIFGPDRCMFGSDWPVCTLAGSYSAVKQALESATAGLSDGERESIFGKTAVEAYRLPDYHSLSESDI
ncbi:MAG: amidohydrolase family protein [Pseudomonadota bacterium]